MFVCLQHQFPNHWNLQICLTIVYYRCTPPLHDNYLLKLNEFCTQINGIIRRRSNCSHRRSDMNYLQNGKTKESKIKLLSNYPSWSLDGGIVLRNNMKEVPCNRFHLIWWGILEYDTEDKKTGLQLLGDTRKDNKRFINHYVKDVKNGNEGKSMKIWNWNDINAMIIISSSIFFYSNKFNMKFEE